MSWTEESEIDEDEWNTMDRNIPPTIRHACEMAQKIPLCLLAVCSVEFNVKHFPWAVQITAMVYHIGLH